MTLNEQYNEALAESDKHLRKNRKVIQQHLDLLKKVKQLQDQILIQGRDSRTFTLGVFICTTGEALADHYMEKLLIKIPDIVNDTDTDCLVYEIS